MIHRTVTESFVLQNCPTEIRSFVCEEYTSIVPSTAIMVKSPFETISSGTVMIFAVGAIWRSWGITDTGCEETAVPLMRISSSLLLGDRKNVPQTKMRHAVANAPKHLIILCLKNAGRCADTIRSSSIPVIALANTSFFKIPLLF